MCVAMAMGSVRDRDKDMPVVFLATQLRCCCILVKF